MESTTTDARAAARRYIERGWKPLPVPHAEKGPRVPNWQNATFDVADFAADDNVGVALGESSGWLVDVDVDHPAALVACKALLPKTDAIFGRPGKPASHWLYVAEGAKTEQFAGVGGRSNMLVELRSTKGQTIFPPSTHVSGEAIEWEVDRDPLKVDAAVLLDAVRLVAVATLVGLAWPDAAGQHHSAALALGGFLSRRKVESVAIRKVMEAVCAIAKDPDVADRVRAARESAEKLAKGIEKVNGGPALATVLGEDVLTRLRQFFGGEVASKTEEIVEQFNEHHFVIRVGRNKRETVVGNDASFPPSFESFQSFRNFHRNAGSIGKKSAADTWLESPRRRTYDGELVFSPPPLQAGDGDYNLWRGFAVAPDSDPHPERRCARYLAHLREVICGDEDPDVAEFLLDVLAAKVQRPADLTEVSVVMRSVPGAGKGTLVEPYLALFGHHAAIVDKSHLVTGKFNATLSSKLALNMDEAMWPGHKEFVGALKSLVTNRTLMIERKGIDAVEEPNYVQLFVTTNNAWAWPFDQGDRRALVLQVLGTKKGDIEYFAAIREEMADGGLSALLAFLQQRAITHDLRKIPRTKAAGGQLMLSGDSIQKWWTAKLHRGTTWPERDDWDAFVSTKNAREDYVAMCHAEREKPLDEASFLEEWMRLMGPKASRARQSVVDREKALAAARRGVDEPAFKRSLMRGIAVPPLHECRRYFAEQIARVRIAWEPDETQAQLPLGKAFADALHDFLRGEENFHTWRWCRDHRITTEACCSESRLMRPEEQALCAARWATARADLAHEVTLHALRRAHADCDEARGALRAALRAEIERDQMCGPRAEATRDAATLS